MPTCPHLLFEPQSELLQSQGLCSHEPLVTTLEDGYVLVPAYNVHGTCGRLEAGVEIGAAKYVYWESGAGLGEESYGLKHPKQDS